MFILNDEESEKLENLMYKDHTSQTTSYIIKLENRNINIYDLLNEYRASRSYNPLLSKAFIDFLVKNNIPHELINLDGHHDIISSDDL